MKLNKTLHPSDYDHLRRHVALFNDITSKIDAIVHHKHRRWEYGVALAALDLIRSLHAKTILDIGGGGSPLPAMIAKLGFNVTVADPSPEANRQGGFNDVLGIHINVDNRDFLAIDTANNSYDAAFCISTLEHVQDDVAFFQKALSVAQHLAVFTVDYHVTGQAQVPHHLRTYNRASLENLARLAGDDWELVDSPAWVDHGAQVNGYNFASLVLRRKAKSGHSFSGGDVVKAELVDADEDTKPEKPKAKRTRRKKAKTSD